MPSYNRLAIIGVGLIGGSIGKAVRERGLAETVVGIGRRRESLELAIQHGTVDETSLSIAEGVVGADLVIAATPVATLVETLGVAAQHAPSAVLTDAGSTKQVVCEEFASQFPESAARFVGSHPIAGGHRTGPAHSRADLFEGSTVVVTPGSGTAGKTTDEVVAFWKALGATVQQMSPVEHDRALAATSHLPHLVAFALAEATPEEFLPLAATGWADTTRIAASDPSLWKQIFSTNREGLLEALARYEDRLRELRTACENEDWATLENHLKNAKRIRDALGD